MNKRTRKKVEKRTGGVKPHTVARAKTKKAAPNAAARPARASRSTKDQGLRSTVEGVARSVARGVRGRATEAVEQIQSKISDTEQRAEELLAKVPLVGEAAAKKLHDIAHR
jgi:hypothetical protein